VIAEQPEQAEASITRAATLAGLLALAGIVVWWAWRAFHDPRTLDLGLAYQAGQVAWATGHPEHLSSWDGTPFLAAVMALISRAIGSRPATTLQTVLNLTLVLATAAVVLRRLQHVLRPVWWWVAAIALLSFAPLMSTVWWKQFNVEAVCLALAGFELLRRRRDGRGAALIGVSIALKPLVFLLPLVLLARRDTRRAGVLSLVWVAALNVAAQALLALRAHSIAALNLYLPLHNFIEKSRPANIWACHPENFAPGSLLCRLAGAQNWTLQHFVVWAAVALLGALVIDALRPSVSGLRSWETFAFTLPLSAMLSPLAWSHYQLLLAPLFLLLLVRFTTQGATVSAWAGLAVAFVLASLIWQPFGTSVGAVRGLFSSKTQTIHDLFGIEAVAQFAQYLLVLTGVIWYTRVGDEAIRGDPGPR
jgi:Glycosyltransferase family 87